MTWNVHYFVFHFCEYTLFVNEPERFTKLETFFEISPAAAGLGIKSSRGEGIQSKTNALVTSPIYLMMTRRLGLPLRDKRKRVAIGLWRASWGSSRQRSQWYT